MSDSEPTTVDEARISEMRFWLGDREGADVALAYELMGSHEILRARVAELELERDGQEQVIKDYEAWIDDACEALGVKTVFEFKAEGDKRKAREAALREALVQAKAYLDLCVMVGDHQSIDDPKALVDSALAAFDMGLAPKLDPLIEHVAAALATTDEGAG